MNHKPFTEPEQQVMDNLVDAYNNFITLKSTHPSHNQDFCDAIHTCQRILGQVALRRMYPDYFSKPNQETQVELQKQTKPIPSQPKWEKDNNTNLIKTIFIFLSLITPIIVYTITYGLP